MNKKPSDYKIFVTGGGTGGHIYPAVSVINELLKIGVPNNNIFYIGNKKNIEYKIANDNGFNFLSTDVFGMPRKFSLTFFKWIILLLLSILKAFYFTIKYKPDVVFGTGGYVSAPSLFVAKILKIPYVLHDSDCAPGIVTRNFAKNAAYVNLAFTDANKKINSNKICNFNNPIRSAFFDKTKEMARKTLNIKDEFLILIMGGSQGAKSINEAAIDVIKKFANKDNIKIILQTGKKNFDEVVKKISIPNNVEVEPYFDDMSVPILASDLIVSRAGSISISEILSSKNPSILVPYPYAASNHQRINARKIEEENAAIYLEDSELKEGKLIDVIENLVLDKGKYNILKENSSRLGEKYKKSNELIIDLIFKAADRI